MDFSSPDANDARVLNQIIWRATMGDQPYPTFDWAKPTTTAPTSNDGDDPLKISITSQTVPGKGADDDK